MNTGESRLVGGCGLVARPTQRIETLIQLYVRLALRENALIQVPIAQEAWLAGTAEWITVWAPVASAPHKIDRERNYKGDCESDNTLKKHLNNERSPL